jgi:hypothetical protein
MARRRPSVRSHCVERDRLAPATRMIAFLTRGPSGRTIAKATLRWRSTTLPSSPARPERRSSRTDAAYASSRICTRRLAPCLRRSARPSLVDGPSSELAPRATAVPRSTRVRERAGPGHRRRCRVRSKGAAVKALIEAADAVADSPKGSGAAPCSGEEQAPAERWRAPAHSQRSSQAA